MKPADALSISRRRWFAAAVSAGATFLGCNRDPLERQTNRPPTIGSSSGDDATPRLISGDPMQSPPPPWIKEPTLNRAVVWLWSQQAHQPQNGEFVLPSPNRKLPRSQDGTWRSTKYAQLKSGQALTPFIMHALEYLRLPYQVFPCSMMSDLAHHSIAQSINADGAVGLNDPELPEYPSYATASALYVLSADNPVLDLSFYSRMSKYLLSQQYTEANGFSPEHPVYGGWGFGGAKPVGESPGHMDIGHTRHVLQALRAAGHNDPQTYARAEIFLSRMQKRDTPGFDDGFFFSPIVLAANKGGAETIDGKPYFRSYATATCDGILALLACGVKPDDARITAAAAWLKKHPRLDFPEGVLEGTDVNWGASIRFYHFAVRAECYAALAWPGNWRDELHAILAKLQQPDGSFINQEGFLMKEDDPLLCTALAVIALSQ